MTTKVEKKIKIKEPIFITDESFYKGYSTMVMEFPRELRRDWFDQVDFRFWTILLITCIIEVGFVFIVSKYTKNIEKSISVQKIQKQYAHLLLKDFTAEDFSALEEKKSDTQLLTSPDFENIDVSEEEPTGNFNVESNNSESILSEEYLERNQKLLIDKQEYLSKKAARKAENRFSSALTREVNQKGLLLFFSGEENSEADENIAEILSNSEKNKKYLNSSIENMSLKKYQKIYSKIKNNTGINNLKGSKTAITSNEQLSSLTPLTKIELASADKNVDLDYFEISDVIKKQNSRTTRTAEHVTRVLMSHNRAIQDCYKQVIKNTPDLKGKVGVRISVNPQGSVELVEIIESTINNDKMLRCIVNRIRRWRDFGACDPDVGVVSYKQTYVFGY